MARGQHFVSVSTGPRAPLSGSCLLALFAGATMTEQASGRGANRAGISVAGPEISVTSRGGVLLAGSVGDLGRFFALSTTAALRIHHEFIGNSSAIHRRLLILERG